MLLYDKYLLLLNFIDCDINQLIWNSSEKSVLQFLVHSSQILDSSSSLRWFFLCVSYKRSTLHFLLLTKLGVYYCLWAYAYT